MESILINQMQIQQAHVDYESKTKMTAKLLKDELKNCYLNAIRDKEQARKL